MEGIELDIEAAVVALGHGGAVGLDLLPALREGKGVEGFGVHDTNALRKVVALHHLMQ